MNLDDELLDRAYAKLTGWGPHLQLSIEDRIKKHFPRVKEEDHEEIIRHVNLVGESVWSLAERGGEAKMKKEDIISALQSSHPFLKKKGLRQAVFLINYYAWHEGHDT